MGIDKRLKFLIFFIISVFFVNTAFPNNSYKNERFLVYKDNAGYPTIGYGHQLKPGESFTNGITEKQANDLLLQDLKNAEDDYMKLIGRTDYSQNKIDAIISFLYNAGGGPKVANSDIIYMLKHNLKVHPKSGKTLEQEFKEWIDKGSAVEKGLIDRRNKEWELIKD